MTSEATSVTGLMDIRAAATYLDVHPETLRQMCRDKRVEFLRLGDSSYAEYRFRQEWLDAFLGAPKPAPARKSRRSH